MDLERRIYRNLVVFLLLILCCGNVEVNTEATNQTEPPIDQPPSITPAETETSTSSSKPFTLQPSVHFSNASTTPTPSSPSTTPTHSTTHNTTTSHITTHAANETSNTTTHHTLNTTTLSTTSTTPAHSPPHSNETGENTTESSSTESTTTTTTTTTSTTPASPTIASSADTVASTSANVIPPAEDNNKDTKIIIGVVVGVGGALLIAVIVILIVLFLRKRGQCCKKSKKLPGPGFGPSHVMTILPYLPDRPIAVADFLDYVSHHQANISAYKAEFESLPPGNKVGKSTSTANEDGNKKLNRYINILPYNDSLVPLSTAEQKGYINASFVDGYRQEKPSYIASQAPLAESLGDFWQMVWEHDCGRIVMVTNLFERGQPKCNKYWPNVNDAANYGQIRVEAIAERTYGDYILRTFKLNKQPSTAKDKPRGGARRSKTEEPEELRETRLVYQFHFTTWPDQGVPNTCTALLKLYRHSIKDDLPDCRPGPVVIHCSAGVGRTGTLIALDLCLAAAKDKNTVDVPRCIDKMRRQRMYMVQTVEQYIFIHHVLLEALTLDKVEIPCATFLTKYQQLIEPTMPDGQSRIQREFKVLEVLKPLFNNSMFSAARQYRDKNRLSSLLPADSFIPYIPNEDETHTYINAVYVFGCPRRAVDDDDEEEGCQYGFIATQHPTSNTIEDFWAMIKETGSSTIVMLNDLDGIERYWPEDGRTINFGAYSVTNMGEIASEDIRMTDLQIAVTKKTKAKTDSPIIADESEYANAPNINESEYANFERQTALYATETFNIRHFRLLSWPDSLPKESTLISLYGEVVRCQERNPNRPVVVHCLYGAERCGVFCGVMSVLDTIKMECEVDVFNAVKRIRRTRPEFIPDLAQYKFLYDVAMEQIKSVDKVDYANARFGTLLLGSSS